MLGTCSSRKQWPQALKRRLFGSCRVLACLMVLSTVMVLLTLRAARAQIREGLHGFGAELMNWQPARLHSTPRRLSLNGLELGLVTASTREGVGEALDRFQALCRKRGGVSVPESVREKLPEGLDGTLRQDSEREGFLACLDTGAPLSLDELAGQLEAFSQGGDLKAIGELRYVFARRSGDTTTLVVFWTEGSASLLRLFPEAGDAPGSDPVDVPRAPNLRRLLSAAEHGAPYSIASYLAESEHPERLRAWYEAALKAGGWSVSQGADTGALVARRGERTVLIRVTTTRAGRAAVTVAELS
jgi:hypothetical protein